MDAIRENSRERICGVQCRSAEEGCEEVDVARDESDRADQGTIVQADASRGRPRLSSTR